MFCWFFTCATAYSYFSMYSWRARLSLHGRQMVSRLQKSDRTRFQFFLHLEAFWKSRPDQESSLAFPEGHETSPLGSSADGRSAKMALLVAGARILSATRAGWIGRPQKEPAILRTCFKVIGGEAHLASHPKSCMFATIWYTFLQNSKIGPPHLFCVEHLCV